MPWCHASYITKYTTLRPRILTGRNDRGRLAGVTTTVRGLQRRRKSEDVADIRLVAAHLAQTREFHADWMGRYLKAASPPGIRRLGRPQSRLAPDPRADSVDSRLARVSCNATRLRPRASPAVCAPDANGAPAVVRRPTIIAVVNGVPKTLRHSNTR